MVAGHWRTVMLMQFRVMEVGSLLELKTTAIAAGNRQHDTCHDLCAGGRILR